MFLIGGGSALIGFFDDPSGSPQCFSQPSLNTPNFNDHMKTYRAPGFDPFAPEYLIAWEDLDLGDADYNDLVVVLQHLEPHPAIECCAVDADCDDADNCTVDTCVNSVCQNTAIDCSYLDDQCNIGMCDPGTGDCVQDPDPKNGDPCNDGLFCTATDLCSDGNVCTDDSCNPASGCVYDNNTVPCDDGDACTENDLCVGGTCVGTQIPGCPCDGEIYLGGAEGICTCIEQPPVDDPPYNRPGRRGLALTCDDIVDLCACFDCEGTVDTVWSIECSKPGLATIVETAECAARVTIDNVLCELAAETGCCTVTVEDPANFWSDSVELQIGEITVDLSEETVTPDTDLVAVEVNVTNNSNTIRAMVMTIAECEPGDNVACTSCVPSPDRALGFTCTASEQPDGSCRVVLYSTADYINEGEGVVATVLYDVLDASACEDCVCLAITSIEAADQFNEELCVCTDTGEICFDVCGDIYPRDCLNPGCAPCGDGVVNLFDILEAVDIILGVEIGCGGERYEATACQLENGDVPNGTPPYCGEDPAYNNCEGDGDIDILDLVVIIDMALGRLNCCDYCATGTIY